MVSCSELMIGNYVKCKVSNDAGIYRVIALDGYNLKVMLDGARFKEWYLEDKIKPIKLTAKILEDIGFKFDGSVYEWSLDNVVIDTYPNDSAFYYKGKDFKITNLHQLQNLLSTLTKTELNITL